MPRLLDKGKATTKPSLYARSRGGKRMTVQSSVLPDADPLEAKREAALLQSTAAKLVMTRRRAERLRDSLVDRDRSQSEVGAATVELIEMLRGAGLSKETIKAIVDDLGDLAIEALRVTE